MAIASMKRDELPTNLGGTSDLLLGVGAEFEGKLTFRGTVRIDSKFKGTIITNDVLVVGENARIEADVTCGSIIVHGELIGNVKAAHAVELRQPARVRGDLETPSLSMEKGVVHNGAVRMEGAGRSATPRPAGPAPIAS
ncbi:MAG TPA: polymer-forming cytoskeletal protein [Solirubrobacter sp.]|nr:polymer-forming cytoskeletal protein [Anaeromyxobacteraceae bacterium]